MRSCSLRALETKCAITPLPLVCFLNDLLTRLHSSPIAVSQETHTCYLSAVPRERATVDVCSGFKLIMFGVGVNVAHVLSSYHLQAMGITFMFIYILCTLFSMEKLGERLLFFAVVL